MITNLQNTTVDSINKTLDQLYGETMNKHLGWILPIAAMAILAPFSPWLDLAISHYFYDPHHTFETSSWHAFIYDYGTIPAIVTGVIGVILFFCSLYIPEWQKWRKSGLILMLTTLIGSFLVVNVILKDHWGRPRPKQVIEFGGAQTFRPFYKPNFFNQPEPSKSFPCGHCAQGFYFFAIILVGKRLKSLATFLIGLSLTIVLGLLLSWTRIAQGGHFFSDVLMSALIMWLTAYSLHLGLPEHERAD